MERASKEAGEEQQPAKTDKIADSLTVISQEVNAESRVKSALKEQIEANNRLKSEQQEKDNLIEKYKNQLAQYEAKLKNYGE